MEAGDWRTQFSSDSRQRFVDEIFDMMKTHPQYSGTDDEIRKDAEFVEENVYSLSRSKSDYQRKIYDKLRRIFPEYKSNVRRPCEFISDLLNPASVDVAAVGDDWREEVYQKIQTMRGKYVPVLAEIHEKVATELEQFDSLPQQLETEELDNMRIIEIKLKRIIFMLSVHKNYLLPVCKKELNSSYEKKIIDFIDAYKSMNPVSFLDRETLSLPDLPSWLPTITLPEPAYDAQTNPQSPSMMQFMVPPGTAQMQQWKMQSQQHQIQAHQQQKLHLMQQHQQRLHELFEWERREEQYLYQLEQQLPQVGFDSGVIEEFLPRGQYPGFYTPAYPNPVALFPTLSPVLVPAPFPPSTSTLLTPSFAPVKFENPVHDAYISHQSATYGEAGSQCPASNSAGNGMPTISSPSLLPRFEKAGGTTQGNASTTDFGKPDIKEQPHDPMVNMAKPNSLRSTVVTMADEAAAAVGEELAAMRKQGLNARTFFIQTGMTGAEKMRCYLGAFAMFVLIIYFIYDLYTQY
ncbi:MEDIATOR 15_1, Non-Recognition-of-BTH 4 [Hibiscus trionum]|uniref:MEDIATOR 15_1, Non-Recognition-of-BTH 4 n=1 Tax=Hibiscus trionum TaxID=183268 RepID=A0A9W7M912_HIBTR|nr:MEDIATOR 15_1, Non-Recognition-of-BTH 4 [Hibiscus trionum]